MKNGFGTMVARRHYINTSKAMTGFNAKIETNRPIVKPNNAGYSRTVFLAG